MIAALLLVARSGSGPAERGRPAVPSADMERPPRLSFERVGPTHHDAVELAALATEEGDRVYADRQLPPAPSLEDLLHGGGRVVVAYGAGEPVACGALRLIAPSTGEIKRMFVMGKWRGQGIGRRLLAALEAEAAALGCSSVRLDTGSRQLAALALYRTSGYTEIDDYNHQPGAENWFEKRLVGG